MGRRKTWVVLSLIIVVGMAARCFGIVERSVWFDESFSWRITRYPVGEMLERVTRDVHPPLYYLVLKAWIGICGSSMPSMRLLSVVLGGVSIVGTFFLAREAWQNQRGFCWMPLLCAALVATSVFQIRYAWEVRMYAQGAALWTCSSVFLLRALRAARPMSWWLLWALATAAFAYTHYYAFFSLAAQGLFVLGWVAAASCGRDRLRLAWNVAAAGALVVALYAPWMAAFRSQRAEVQESFWTLPIDRWTMPFTIHQMLIGGPETDLVNRGFDKPAAIICTLVTIAVFGMLLVGGSTVERYFLVSAALPLILPALISVLQNRSIVSNRYFTFAHIGLILCIAAVLSRIQRPKLRGSAAATLLVGNVLVAGWFMFDMELSRRPGVQAAAELLRMHLVDGERFVVGNSRIFFPLVYYTSDWAEPKLCSDPAHVEHFGGRQVLEPEDQIDPDEAWRNAAVDVWVVDTTGFGSINVPAPKEWEPVSVWVFPEAFWWQGEVVVKRYRKLARSSDEPS
jgi:uncharacterized membrane protein